MTFSVQQLYRRQMLALSALLVILLVGLFFMFSVHEGRISAKQGLMVQAKMVADMLLLVSPIEGDDAQQVLAHATVNPTLIQSCLFDMNGNVLAKVPGPAFRPGYVDNACDNAWLLRHMHQVASVRIPVTSQALPAPVGELVMAAEIRSVGAQLMLWGSIAFFLGLLFALVCLALGLRLERILLKPIRQISSTAQRVTLYKDYSLRVVPGALSVIPSEIELLTDSFNAMLHEIEDRDNRLSRKSEELEKSRQAAVSANQAKSQFLANVSHELRTPLNAILGFSTMLSSEQFGALGNPKYKEYASDIHDSGKHLLDVINDILDISKAETGTLKITIEQLNLHKIIEKALNIVSGQAHERKIDIYTDLPDRLPKIYADRVRLIQILLNLLSNAIKFSNEGGSVTVRCKVESGMHGIYYVFIEVEDNGIGMSAEEMNKVFATFNQSDAGLNRKYEGAGLGLPLTKRLVELHHGKIKLHSAPGKGTTVTVRLTSDPALFQ